MRNTAPLLATLAAALALAGLVVAAQGRAAGAVTPLDVAAADIAQAALRELGVTQ